MKLFSRQGGTRHWSFDLSAILAGAALPLSLAPFYVWPLGIISPVLLAILLTNQGKWRAYLRSFLFALGLYGVGASWVFRSIFDFGFASLPLALILTGLFVCGLALVFAIPFYIYGRYFGEAKKVHILAFAALWVLGEWSRSWFLTGFPWLYVGYAHADTWLAGWAPLFGVFGLSFLAVSSGFACYALVSHFLKKNKTPRENLLAPIRLQYATGFLLFSWLAGLLLNQVSWTKQNGETVLKTAIMQPNIPQHYKWDPLYYPYIMQTMRDLSSPTWAEVDLLLWPENAVPLFYHEAEAYLEEQSLRANASNTALITGILYDSEETYTWYNSIIGLGKAEGTYFKQRLVPFGEYVPMEKWLRGLLRFFDLPNSLISAGEPGQQALRIGSLKLANSICYEVVYPGLVAEYAQNAGLLITISNDAWFGDSIGPIQHFQMAQMRALENGKYLLRATNNGISGVVSDKGIVLGTLKHSEQNVLLSEVKIMHGATPFSSWKSLPAICLSFLLLILAIKNKRPNKQND